MISNIILDTNGGSERLKAYLRTVMPAIIPRGVSRITDFTMLIRFPTVSFIDDSDGVVLSITETHRLTLYFSRRRLESQTVTVYELARDKDSPPFETKTEYSQIRSETFVDGRSSPFIFRSVIEVQNAPASNLLAALAAACLKKAKKAIADNEGIQ